MLLNECTLLTLIKYTHTHTHIAPCDFFLYIYLLNKGKDFLYIYNGMIFVVVLYCAVLCCIHNLYVWKTQIAANVKSVQTMSTIFFLPIKTFARLPHVWFIFYLLSEDKIYFFAFPSASTRVCMFADNFYL